MRKVYIFPNMVTTLNMFSGFFSIIASTKGQFELAAWAILIASVFDSLDGRVARMAKATSSFGVEYDSLSDLISFGAAPAILVYLESLQRFGRPGWLVAFLFLACGALRLARFNVSTETAPKAYFLGLPIPMAANLISTFVIFQSETQVLTGQELGIFLMVFVPVLALFMVSNVHFKSFKEVNWRSKASSGYFLAGILFLFLIAWEPRIVPFLILLSYTVVSVIFYLWNYFVGSSAGRAVRTKKGKLSSSEPSIKVLR